jgi:hypothetical protein
VLASYDVQVHVDDAAAATCTVDAAIVDSEDAFVVAPVLCKLWIWDEPTPVRDFGRAVA